MRDPNPTSSESLARDHAALTRLIESKLERRPLRIEAIPAGLGTRRFHRIHFENGRPASMIGRLEDDESVAPPAASADTTVPDAPPWLPEPPLEPLRSFLEQAGIRVPRSYGHERDDRSSMRIDLLEDLGDETLADAPEHEREALYRFACATIPRLQRLEASPATVPAFARVLDASLLQTKLWKWLHWTIPLLLKREATPAESRTLGRLFEGIARLVEAAPRRLSHRDYKAENLHRAPAEERQAGSDPLVLIDVQGAFLAPPEYDLVCLLYDLQVELDEAFVRSCFEETLPQLPDAPATDEAWLRFDALAVARLCKDISHVVHAGCVRGDDRRWHEIPRGLTLLARAAGRLEASMVEAEALTSVIQALTPTVLSADSRDRG